MTIGSIYIVPDGAGAWNLCVLRLMGDGQEFHEFPVTLQNLRRLNAEAANIIHDESQRTARDGITP